ncbi:hypothetical protein HDU76_008395 [Blyttiomyces sp. JEL0837]|nr:hypothetical protein HDU76_008395 [Blyttiomyces sp. JEL0837]
MVVTASAGLLITPIRTGITNNKNLKTKILQLKQLKTSITLSKILLTGIESCDNHIREDPMMKWSVERLVLVVFEIEKYLERLVLVVFEIETYLEELEKKKWWMSGQKNEVVAEKLERFVENLDRETTEVTLRRSQLEANREY